MRRDTKPRVVILGYNGNDWSASINGHYMTGEKPYVPTAEEVGPAPGQDRHLILPGVETGLLAPPVRSRDID